jgi:hypothetical protein
VIVELDKILELIEFRQVGGNGMQFRKVAAGELVEVDARIGGGIHGRSVEAGDGIELLSVAGWGRGLRGAGESDAQQTTRSGQQGVSHGSPPESKQR